MYLSKLELDASVTRNPYEIHREIWKLFRNDGKRERDFLFRVDWRGVGGPRTGLLLSRDAPEPAAALRVRLVDSREARLRLHEGQVLRFALSANVVKRLNQARSRVPLVRHDERIAWLRRKLDGAANLIEADVVGSRSVSFLKGANAGKVDIVDFAGLIEVTDAIELVKRMAAGIGPAKSFGCGLLTLARA